MHDSVISQNQDRISKNSSAPDPYAALATEAWGRIAHGRSADANEDKSRSLRHEQVAGDSAAVVPLSIDNPSSTPPITSNLELLLPSVVLEDAVSPALSKDAVESKSPNTIPTEACAAETIGHESAGSDRYGWVDDGHAGQPYVYVPTPSQQSGWNLYVLLNNPQSTEEQITQGIQAVLNCSNTASAIRILNEGMPVRPGILGGIFGNYTEGGLNRLGRRAVLQRGQILGFTGNTGSLTGSQPILGPATIAFRNR